MNNKYDLTPYKINDEKSIDVVTFQDDVWVTQRQMAELFSCSSDNISLHLKNIFESGELEKNSVTEKISVTANDGKNYITQFYNLDAIISVGYRVNSKRGVQFRQWATKVIKNRIKLQYIHQEESKNDEENGRSVKIRQWLRKSGITQRQIAKELGFSEVTVCICLSGKSPNPVINRWIDGCLGASREERPLFEKSKELLKMSLNGDLAAYESSRALLNITAEVFTQDTKTPTMDKLIKENLGA